MSRDKQEPRQLSMRLRYQGRKFGFEVAALRLPNGVEGEFETIRHPGGAMAVPVTGDGRFVLVRQYRFPVGDWLLEFPAGTVEDGEDPAGTIERELQEETGYRARQWRDLGRFPLAPGYSDEHIHAFLARELEALAEPPAQDEDEDLETVLLTEDELRDAVAAGHVDAKTMGGYLLARDQL
ncbi:NUDIX hydrolase [Thiohalorhabdus sp. Cl-TMA]|uniref:GDP-mannose pyrophosphatase n=1 Tax=Thiohalorhabdus methylotrophus TaxID=3242694 RepID=A0ABV4TQG1_9GAMM